ncbi:MAG: hypothetical protein HYZ47_02615 [Simkania negevensis]|nr:hypothetical protein [Simkania negevensis]
MDTQKPVQHLSHQPLAASKEKSQEKKKDPFLLFKEEFNQKKRAEEKMECALTFMQELLSQKGPLRLKNFWDAQYLCSTLFKEKFPSDKKNAFWMRYSQMKEEASRLKEIMDEEALFSVEQIELAIEALEGDYSHFKEMVEKFPLLTFPKKSAFLESKLGDYKELQRELQFLRTLTLRLEALRAETLTTGMKISIKNRLLKRLSLLGDLVFPKRKELLKSVSDQFMQDVERFAKEHFSFEKEEERSVAKELPFYLLREEVKGLQALGKELMLTASAFNKMRKTLSKCWDCLKEKEEEKKRDLDVESEESKKKKEEILVKITQFACDCEKGEGLSKERIGTHYQMILQVMNEASLTRPDAKQLRDKLEGIRYKALDKIAEKLAAEEKTEIGRVENLKKELTSLLEKIADTDLDLLLEKEGMLRKEIEELPLNSIDYLIIARKFSILQGALLDKRAEEAGKEEWESIYENKQELLAAIKEEIEGYRKEMSGSGLDFNKAMLYRELFNQAKSHLEREQKALVLRFKSF